jgi:hypothetical protein
LRLSAMTRPLSREYCRPIELITGLRRVDARAGTGRDETYGDHAQQPTS